MERIGIKTKKRQQYLLLSTSNPWIFCRLAASNPSQELMHPLKQRFPKDAWLPGGKSLRALEIDRKTWSQKSISPSGHSGFPNILYLRLGNLFSHRELWGLGLYRTTVRHQLSCTCTYMYVCACAYILMSFFMNLKWNWAQPKIFLSYPRSSSSSVP